MEGFRAGPPGELLAGGGHREALLEEAIKLPSWDLTFRQLCDLELLLNGAFHPLKGYLSRRDYDAVCGGMRLGDGTIWPMPIVMDVKEKFAEALSPGDRVALRHPEGMILALLTIQDLWKPDRGAEAQAVFGTTDESHPGVFDLLHNTNPVYLGGAVEGTNLPPHHTFNHLRHSPRELREMFARNGWERVVAFQTRNPMHRAHVEMTRRAAETQGAKLLIHPVVGRTSPGDLDHFARVRCYQAALKRYEPGSAVLSLLQLAMRMGGPREAVWHAIIRRNHGCTHFIVGRDHAGPRDAKGRGFYGPDEARELACEHASEIGIEIVPFDEMVFREDTDSYVTRPEAPPGARLLSLSGTELRQRLREGLEIPSWFSYPEVVEQLRLTHPPRARQGYTIFFTGLSGAGKSTIANILVAKLMEIDSRPVSLLDGDIVRKNLSSELGFSREHRDLNIRRIGFVAGEITKNRGVAVCAPIAPYRATRRAVREEIARYGGFVEVHIATPLAICEQRDPKGLYAKARAGLIREFTGIDDPYETPERAEVTLDTSHMSPEGGAQEIIKFLVDEGYIRLESAGPDAS